MESEDNNIFHEQNKKRIIMEASILNAVLNKYNEIDLKNQNDMLNISNSDVDYLQSFIFNSKGFYHLFIQPYNRENLLVPEQHAWLVGALRNPLILYKKGPVLLWESNDDFELTQWFNNNKSLQILSSQLQNISKNDDDWLIQIRALSGGNTHVVVHSYYIQQFLNICTTLVSCLSNFPGIIQQNFIKPPLYTQLFEKFILNMNENKNEQNYNKNNIAINSSNENESYMQIYNLFDYTNSIVNILLQYDNDKIHVGSIPSVKEMIVHQNMVPDELPVIAIIDFTNSGTADDSIVFTPQHCFAKYQNKKISFSLSLLKNVKGFADSAKTSLIIELYNQKNITIQCGIYGIIIWNLFSKLITIPKTTK